MSARAPSVSIVSSARRTSRVATVPCSTCMVDSYSVKWALQRYDKRDAMIRAAIHEQRRDDQKAQTKDMVRAYMLIANHNIRLHGFRDGSYFAKRHLESNACTHTSRRADNALRWHKTNHQSPAFVGASFRADSYRHDRTKRREHAKQLLFWSCVSIHDSESREATDPDGRCDASSASVGGTVAGYGNECSGPATCAHTL